MLISLSMEYCYFSRFLAKLWASQQTSSNFLTSPPTQNFIWSLSLISNIKRRPKKYYGKWLSVLEFSILRSTYFYEFSSFLWTCGKDLIHRIYSQHKLFLIAYCLLQKLNLGLKNNFDKVFPLWYSLSRVILFVCPTSIWNDLRPTSNATYSTHLWHFSPASCVPSSLDLTQGIQ